MEINQQRGKSYGVQHLLASFSGPLDKIIEKSLELQLEKVRFLREFGCVYVNNSRCLENKPIETGTYLRVHQNPRRFPTEVFRWPTQKIFENEQLLVINKPSGLPVPATVDNIQESLSALLSRELKCGIYVTHRLDIGTSGLLIFGKTKAAQAEINHKLAAGEVRKIYRALVHGTNLPTGEWIHYMLPSPRAPKTVSVEARPGWVPCRLRILDQTEVLRNHSEVLVELITGRTHQIRAQLSAAGFPIVGDISYGSKYKMADFEKICLQAFYLEFEVAREKMTFRLDAPDWLRDLTS